MKNGVAYKNKNVYLKINIYLNEESILPFSPMLSLYRNHSTDLWSKSMGWFLYKSKTGLTLLILTTIFSIYIFSFHEEILIPFPQVFILTRHTFRKTINQECKWKMKQIITTNNFMFFWIVSLYLSWYAERKSTAYFAHETFYHTHTPLSHTCKSKTVCGNDIFQFIFFLLMISSITIVISCDLLTVRGT